MVQGHVSRPNFGEGRQQPDRQMFFVNSRPCGLPQMAKIFNEVYKAYNLSQSPFVFANIVLDTNAYDVNVSPDKRTILLHDQEDLLETLRSSLTKLFDSQDHTVPQSQNLKQTLPHFKQLTVQQSIPANQDHDKDEPISVQGAEHSDNDSADEGPNGRSIGGLIESFATRDTEERSKRQYILERKRKGSDEVSKQKQKLVRRLTKAAESGVSPGSPGAYPNLDDLGTVEDPKQRAQRSDENRPETRSSTDEDHCVPSTTKLNDTTASTTPSPPTSSIVQNAYNRMRPRRISPEVAEVTVGDNTTTMVLGPTASELRTAKPEMGIIRGKSGASHTFSSSLKAFAAPGAGSVESYGEDEDDEEEDSQHDLESISQVDEVTSYNSDTQEITSKPVSIVSGSPESLEQDRLHEVTDEIGAIEDHEHPKDSSENGQDQESDEEYLDDVAKKRKDEARVAYLVQKAEEAAARPTEDNIHRAHSILKGGSSRKDTTRDLTQIIEASAMQIITKRRFLKASVNRMGSTKDASTAVRPVLPSTISPEDRLSLTVAKTDFLEMHIVGQFNLGFILALRSPFSSSFAEMRSNDLFVIDQHASDEKINFERLQRYTIMQTQRLVRPLPLDLTAIEEEVILENQEALEANGFGVSIDASSDRVGKRCHLVSLPMSQNTVFTLSDLEELIALLAENPPAQMSASGQHGKSIPRPTKIRKIFASRACRSSVMIGDPLTRKQMAAQVGRMGGIEKPWNCPHGRPTMRHVLDLGEWEGWLEDEGAGEGILEILRQWGCEVEQEDKGEEETRGEGKKRDGGDDGIGDDTDDEDDGSESSDGFNRK